MVVTIPNDMEPEGGQYEPRHEVVAGWQPSPNPEPAQIWLSPLGGNGVMDTQKAATALAALGNDLRLQLWQMLAPHGADGLSAGLIAERVRKLPSSLSFHLHQLTQAGVLVQRRSSRNIIYAVNSDLVDALCVFLSTSGGQVIRLPPAVASPEEAHDIVSDS